MGPPAAMAAPTHAIPGYQYGDEQGDFPPERSRRRRTILLWVLGLLVVLAAVAAAAYLVLGGATSKAVPSVIGQKLSAAQAAVRKAGLVPVVRYQSSASFHQGHVITTSPLPGTSEPAGSKVTLFVSSGPKQVPVPGVKNLSLTAATTKLQQAGFKVKPVTVQSPGTPPNTVVKQSPVAGATAAEGSTVTVYVTPGGVTVPGVVGENYQTAESNLTNAGLNYAVQNVQAPGVANGTVVKQRPKGGHVVARGTTVTLYVVSNPAPTPTPTSTPTPTPTGTPTPTPSESSPGQQRHGGQVAG
jgi:serine/threonine-protein kinase